MIRLKKIIILSGLTLSLGTTYSQVDNSKFILLVLENNELETEWDNMSLAAH